MEETIVVNVNQVMLLTLLSSAPKRLSVLSSAALKHVKVTVSANRWVALLDATVTKALQTMAWSSVVAVQTRFLHTRSTVRTHVDMFYRPTKSSASIFRMRCLTLWPRKREFESMMASSSGLVALTWNRKLQAIQLPLIQRLTKLEAGPSISSPWHSHQALDFSCQVLESRWNTRSCLKIRF